MEVWHRFVALLREDFEVLFSVSGLRKENYLRLLLYLSFFTFTVLAFYPVFFSRGAREAYPKRELQAPYRNEGFESPQPQSPGSENEGRTRLPERTEPSSRQFDEITDI